MRSNKLTISIGIPAYNEEKTIVFVIDSLLNQIAKSFFLENIFVVSDGSTDKTTVKVRESFRNNNKVIVIDGLKRLGKSKRLLQIFKRNKSDVVLIFDGDIEIRDKMVVEKLVKMFRKYDFALVSGNSQPKKTNFFFGRIWYANEILWYQTRKDYLNGNNIYNNSGQCIAISRDLAKKIFLPKYTVADQQFVYISAIKQGAKFIFVDDAVSYYVPPTTLNDIVLQIRRTVGEREFLFKYFNTSCDHYFYIPISQKFIGFLRAIRIDLIYTILAIFVFNLIRLLIKDTDPLTKKGQWSIAKSTKKI